MPVSKLEQWIAPRALKILAAIAALVIVLGAGAFFLVRAHDLERVSHLERVIQCQDSRECRRFVKRAIRAFLRQREHQRSRHPAKKRPAVIFRFRSGPAAARPEPELVEVPGSPETPSKPPHGTGESKPTKHRKAPPLPAEAPSVPAASPPAPSAPEGGPPGQGKGNGLGNGHSRAPVIEVPQTPVAICGVGAICPSD